MRMTKKKTIGFLAFAFCLSVCSGALLAQPAMKKAAAEEPFTTTSTICVQTGASIRVVDEETSGIRFQSNVNKVWYDSLTAPKAGSIIVPQNYVAKATESGADLTLNGLIEVVKTNSLPFQAVNTADFNTQGDYYTYALSLTDILEQNYTRDFVSISYVMSESLTSGESVSGQSEYGLEDGKYVIAYDATNVRSVYQVAYNGLTSGDSLAPDHKAVMQSYADGVVDLEEVDGELVIANNDKAGYTSPYTLNATGSTVFNAKNVLLNGARTTEFPIKVGEKSVHITKTQNATFEGEEMTLQGAIPTAMVGAAQLSSLDGTEGDVPKNIGYYALNGSYDVGTYLDISFTGKNIPSVMFFADKINGDFSHKGGNGLIVLNGGESATTANATNKGIHFSNVVKVAGPTRVTSEALAGWVRVSDTFASTSETGKAKQVTGLGKFAYANLEDGGQYRYIIGTFEQEGNVWLEVGLYNNGFKVEQLTFDTNLAKSQFSAGNIMLLATLKKDASNNPVDTTFTFNGVLDAYPEIATMKKGGAGAAVNADGSFTLSDIGALANSNVGTIRAKELGYVGWEGEYGVGTYVEFEFTGNNMPQLCFFADEVNGWVTCGNNTGIKPTSGFNKGFVILNGINSNSLGEVGYTNAVNGYGMERVYYGGTTSSSKVIVGGKMGAESEIQKQLAECLSQDGLKANGDVTYRMVIGTSVAEGKLWLNIYLFNATTNAKIFGGNLMTDYATTDGSELKGGIIAMAGLKNGETTTFKVTKAPATIDQFDIVGAEVAPES